MRPLLFCLYINNISANFGDCVSHLVYADDFHWDTLNNLKLNVDKTKAMVIGSYFYIHKLSDMATRGIVQDQTFIKFETCALNLGVWLDSKLNSKVHVRSICENSLLYRLNYFKKTTNLGPQNTSSKLYSSLW